MFGEGGDPSFEFLSSARDAGLPFAAFPWLAEGYVIHRGRGSLAWVAANEDRSNRFYEWALQHRDPHYGNLPGAAARYQALQEEFRAAVPGMTPAELVCVCS